MLFLDVDKKETAAEIDLTLSVKPLQLFRLSEISVSIYNDMDSVASHTTLLIHFLSPSSICIYLDIWKDIPWNLQMKNWEEILIFHWNDQTHYTY